MRGIWRYFEATKTHTINFVKGVFRFSKSEAAAGIGTGAAHIYYFAQLLRLVIDDLPAISIAAPSGFILGLALVYHARKKNKESTAIADTQLIEEHQRYLDLSVKHITAQVQLDLLHLRQVHDHATHKILAAVPAVIDKSQQGAYLSGDDIKKVRFPSFTTDHSSSFSGSVKPKEITPRRDLSWDLLHKKVKPSEEKKTEDVKCCGINAKVRAFFKETPKAVIIGYMGMITYYLEFCMDDLGGINIAIALPLSFILSCIASPALVFVSTESSRKKLNE